MPRRGGHDRLGRIVDESEDFDEFYRATYVRTLKLAVLLAHDRSRAAELTQDAYADAFAHWTRIGTYERPDLWVRRAIVNRSVSLGRRRGSEASAMARLRGGVAPRSNDADAGLNIGIWHLVGALPDRQAHALALVYGMDMSISEASDVMDCSEGSVKTHLSRGRSAVASALAGEEQHDG